MTKNIEKHIFPWVDSSRKINPTGIILHWWQEPIEKGGIDFLESLLAPKELSVHFAVMADGTVYQCVESAEVRCCHAKDANASTIGIEIQGLNAHDLDTNQEQFDSVVSLVRALMNMYEIGPDYGVHNLGETDMYFSGLMTHQMVDVCCKKANGKTDVHLEYLIRVRKAVLEKG